MLYGSQMGKFTRSGDKCDLVGFENDPLHYYADPTGVLDPNQNPGHLMMRPSSDCDEEGVQCDRGSSFEVTTPPTPHSTDSEPVVRERLMTMPATAQSHVVLDHEEEDLALDAEKLSSLHQTVYGSVLPSQKLMISCGEDNEDANVDCDSLDNSQNQPQVALEFVTNSDKQPAYLDVEILQQDQQAHSRSNSHVEVIRLDAHTFVSGTDTERASQLLNSSKQPMRHSAFYFTPKLT